MNEIVPATGLVPANMDEALRLAKVMSSTRLVPEHLQGDIGGCMLIIEQAMRWKMSPFAVAQCTSLIYGRLMHEGKLVAAAVHTSGALATRFTYTYSGEGDDRQCTVTARLRGEDADRLIWVVLKDVRTTDKNGKPNKQWTGGQVDQQLSYAGVRAWARRHAPEVLLGVYAPEEFDEPAQPQHKGPTIEAVPEAPSPPPPDLRDQINDEVQLKNAAAGMQRPPSVSAKARGFREILSDLRRDLAAAGYDQAKINAVIETQEIRTARETFMHAAKRELEALIEAALQGAYREPAIDDDPFAPGLEIVGQDKVAAGD